MKQLLTIYPKERANGYDGKFPYEKLPVSLRETTSFLTSNFYSQARGLFFIRLLLVLLLICTGVNGAWGQTTETTVVNCDFENGETLFTNQSRISSIVNVRDDANGTNVVKFTTDNNAANVYGLATYNFSSLTANAEKVFVSFDTYITSAGPGYHIYFTLGDADLRNGWAKGTYPTTGAIFNVGIYRTSSTNYFSINGATTTSSTTNLLSKWIHVEVNMDFSTKKLSYSIKNFEQTTTYYSSSNVSFIDTNASSCSLIDFYDMVNSHASMMDNLVVKKTIDESKVFADYTIKYVNSEGTEIKDSRTANGQATSTCNILDSDKASFVYNGQKYIYVSDDAASKTIAADGTTVVTVTFREAATYSYTVKASTGLVLQESSSFEGDEITVPIPRVFNAEGTIYSAGLADNVQSSTTFTLDANNKTVIVNYSATSKTNVIFFSEAEDIAGFTKEITGNVSIRCSNMAGGHTTSAKTITTLLPGEYTINVAHFSNNKLYFSLGSTSWEFDGSSRWTESSKSFTLTSSSTITGYLGAANSSSAMDYIYIIGKPMHFTSESGTIDVSTTSTTIATTIYNAIGTVTYASNDQFVATVNSEGVITGVGNGKTTITATDSKGQTATYTVTVKGEKANYTVKWVLEGGTEVKSETRSGEVFASIALTTADKNSFTESGKTYLYVSDDCTGKTIARDGSTIVTITVKEQKSYTYTLTSSLTNQPIGSGTAVDNTTATAYYPMFELQGTTLYQADAQSSDPWYGKKKTLTENLSEEIEYKNPIKEVVYYVEAENLPNAKKETSKGNADVRASNGVAAHFNAGTSYTLYESLPRGKYLLYSRIVGGSTDNNTTFTFKAGSDEIQTTTTNGSATPRSSVFTIDEVKNITFTVDVEYDSRLLDVVYIQRLPMSYSAEGEGTDASGSINYAEGATLTPTLYNAEGTVTYSSDNEDVATVDSEGKITVVSPGTVVITATDSQDQTAKYTLSIKGLKFAEPEVTLYLEDLWLINNFYNGNALTNTTDETTINYTLSDGNSVRFSNTNTSITNNSSLYAYKLGTATVTATAGSYSASYTVTVSTRNSISDLSTLVNGNTFTVGDVGTITSNSVTTSDGVTMTIGNGSESIVVTDKLTDSGKGIAVIKTGGQIGKSPGDRSSTPANGTYYKFKATESRMLIVTGQSQANYNGETSGVRLRRVDGGGADDILEPSYTAFHEYRFPLEAGMEYWLYGDDGNATMAFCLSSFRTEDMSLSFAESEKTAYIEDLTFTYAATATNATPTYSTNVADPYAQMDDQATGKLRLIKPSGENVTVVTASATGVPSATYNLTVTTRQTVEGSVSGKTYTIGDEVGLLQTEEVTGVDGITMSFGSSDEVQVVRQINGSFAATCIDAAGYTFKLWESNEPTMGTFYKFTPTESKALTVTGYFDNADNGATLWEVGSGSVGTISNTGTALATGTFELTAGKTYLLYGDANTTFALKSFNYQKYIPETATINISDLLYKTGITGVDGHMDRKIPGWKISTFGTGEAYTGAGTSVVTEGSVRFASASPRGILIINPDVPEAQKGNVVITSVTATISNRNASHTINISGKTDNVGNPSDGVKNITLSDFGSQYQNYISIQSGSGTENNWFEISKIKIDYKYFEGTEFNTEKGAVALTPYEDYTIDVDESESVSQSTFTTTTDANAAYSYPEGFSGVLTTVSSDERIATYDGSTVAKVADGDATITTTFAGTDYFAEANAVMNVTSSYELGTDVAGLKFNNPAKKIEVGSAEGSYTNTATSCTGETVTYEIKSDPKGLAASIDTKTGLVTLRKDLYGEANAELGTITVKASTSSAEATYKLVVKKTGWFFSDADYWTTEETSFGTTFWSEKSNSDNSGTGDVYYYQYKSNNKQTNFLIGTGSGTALQETKGIDVNDKNTPRWFVAPKNLTPTFLAGRADALTFKNLPAKQTITVDGYRNVDNNNGSRTITLTDAGNNQSSITVPAKDSDPTPVSLTNSTTGDITITFGNYTSFVRSITLSTPTRTVGHLKYTLTELPVSGVKSALAEADYSITAENGTGDYRAYYANDGKPTTFSSSNESVITVDPVTGEITPVAEGTAFVIATTTNAPTSSAEYQEVTFVSDCITVDASTNFNVAYGETNKKVTLKTGSTYTNTDLSTNADGLLRYKSSNYDVATVDATTGEITASAAGTTTITAYLDLDNDGNFDEGEEPSDSYTLTVVDASNIDVTVGETQKTFRNNTFANNINDSGSGSFTYSSSNSSVVAIDHDATLGIITIKGVGLATITATGSDGTVAGSYFVEVKRDKWDFSTTANVATKQIAETPDFNEWTTVPETAGLTFQGSWSISNNSLVVQSNPAYLRIPVIKGQTVEFKAGKLNDSGSGNHWLHQNNLTNATTTYAGNPNYREGDGFRLGDKDGVYFTNTGVVSSATYAELYTNEDAAKNGTSIKDIRTYFPTATVSFPSNEANVFYLAGTEQEIMKATYSEEGAATKAVLFTSSDESIVTVDPWTGKVKTVTPTEEVTDVTITATVIGQIGTTTGGETASYTLNVMPATMASATIDVEKLLYMDGATAKDGGMNRQIPRFDITATGDNAISSDGKSLHFKTGGSVIIAPRLSSTATASDKVKIYSVIINYAKSPYDHDLSLNGVTPTHSDALSQTFALESNAQETLTLALSNGNDSIVVNSLVIYYNRTEGSTDIDKVLDQTKKAPQLSFLVTDAINATNDQFQNTVIGGNYYKNFDTSSMTYSGSNDDVVSVESQTGIITTTTDHTDAVTITGNFAETDYFASTSASYTVTQQKALAPGESYTFNVLNGQVVEVTATATENGQHLENTGDQVLANNQLSYGTTQYKFVTTAESDGKVILTNPNSSSATITISDVNVYWLPFTVEFSYPRSFVYYESNTGRDNTRFYLDNPAIKVTNQSTGADVSTYFNVNYTCSDTQYATVHESTGKVTGVKEKRDGVVITATLTPKSGLDDTKGYHTLTAQYVVNVIPFSYTWDFTGGASEQKAFGLSLNASRAEYTSKGLKLLARPMDDSGNIDTSNDAYVDVPVRAGMKLTVSLYTDDSQLESYQTTVRYTARMTISNTTTTEYLVTSVLPLYNDIVEHEFYAYEDGVIKIRNTTGYSHLFNSGETSSSYDVPPMDCYIRSISVEEPTLMFQDAEIGNDDVNNLNVGISQNTVELVPLNLHEDFNASYVQGSTDSGINVKSINLATGNGVTEGTATVTSGTESTTGFGNTGNIIINVTATPKDTNTPAIPIRPEKGTINLDVSNMHFEKEDSESEDADGLPIVSVTLAGDGKLTIPDATTKKPEGMVTNPYPTYSCTTVSGTAEGHITNYYKTATVDGETVNVPDEGKYDITIRGEGTLKVTATSGTISTSYIIQVTNTAYGVFPAATPVIEWNNESSLTYKQTVNFEGATTVKYEIKGMVSQALSGSVTGTPIQATIGSDGTVTVTKGCGVVHVQAEGFDNSDSKGTADYYLTVAYPITDDTDSNEHWWNFQNVSLHNGNVSSSSAVGSEFINGDNASKVINGQTKTGTLDTDDNNNHVYGYMTSDGLWEGYDGSNTGRPMWKYNKAVNGDNGFILQETAGLIITAEEGTFAARNTNLDGGGRDMRGIGLREGATLTIPCLKAGDYIDLVWGRYGTTSGEKVALTNLTDIHGKDIPMLAIGGSFNSGGTQQGYYTFKVKEDGNVSFTGADGGTLRFFQIHVYRGEYKSSFNDAIKEWDGKPHSEQMNKEGIFMEADEEQYVTFTYFINMGGPNGTVRMELRGWDESLIGAEFNENWRTIHPGANAYYQIPRFRFFGGWGKAYIKATAYDNDYKYVVGEMTYTVTVGKKPEIKAYPYTWDFTRYLENTRKSTQSDISFGVTNTWEKSSTDENTLVVDTEGYGLADYKSYYVPGAQLVAENDTIVRDMQGLGWAIASGGNADFKPTSDLKFNMADVVTETQLTAKSSSAGTREGEPTIYTPGQGYAAFTGKITIPRPESHTWNVGQDWANGGYRIYVKMKGSTAPGVEYADNITESSDRHAKEESDGDQVNVFVFVPTDNTKDVILSFSDANIYQIGVTNVTKELTPVGNEAWATESRDVDINHALTSYFTQNEAEAYTVKYENYDLHRASVGLTKVGRVDKYNGVVIKQPYKKEDGIVKAVSPTGVKLTDGQKVTVPLFYNAISTPGEDLSGNMMEPVYRDWDTDRNHPDGVLRTSKQFTSDNEEDGYTNFILTNIYWTYNNYNEELGEDGKTWKPKGEGKDRFDSAAGFFRLHLSETGNTAKDEEANKLEGHKAWLRTNALPTAVWNGDDPNAARKQDKIAIRSFGYWDDDDITDIKTVDANGLVDRPNQDNRSFGPGWFTLSGQRIDEPKRPGLYIRNGQKVVVK